MQLIEKKVTRKLKDYKEIEQFMKRVFPKEELFPMWMISIITLMKNYKFNAYYDNDLFVGILFTIETKGSLFVFYLAVNDKIQSKGYGSILLSDLKAKYPNKPISLFIETMDPKASNYEQRVKRLAFYQRKGFYDTNIKAGFNEPFVDILATDPNFSKADCKKLLKFMPMKLFTK